MVQENLTCSNVLGKSKAWVGAMVVHVEFENNNIMISLCTWECMTVPSALV